MSKMRRLRATYSSQVNWSRWFGRDVEQRRDVGAAARELELRMADLQHGRHARRRLVEQLQQAPADVAAEHVLPSSGGEDRVDQGGGRRLAARAGDADERPGVAVEEEAGHALDGDAGAARSFDGRVIQRHALGDADHVGALDVARVVGAKRDAHAEGAQRLHAARHGIERADVDARAVADEVARHVLALDAEADDDDLLAAPVRHRHQSTTARATPAKPPSIPMIQKRATTCVSFQPESWKW